MHGKEEYFDRLSSDTTASYELDECGDSAIARGCEQYQVVGRHFVLKIFIVWKLYLETYRINKANIGSS